MVMMRITMPMVLLMMKIILTVMTLIMQTLIVATTPHDDENFCFFVNVLG